MHRPATYALPQSTNPRSGPNVTDDYERWYTESTPSNRMLLSLRSGIDSEISWALDRLCRLCNNEQFLLRSIPGLTDALFEWPEWYISDGQYDMACVFSIPKEVEKKRRHALESLFILRNSAINEPNAAELARHPRTLPLLLRTLHILSPDSDTDAEFSLNAIELLQTIAIDLVVPASSVPETNPVAALQSVAGSSRNRSLVIASLTTLNILLSNPNNSVHLSPQSPALAASLRYLPLFFDTPLVDTCLNYLYTHLSHYSTAKTFLLHPDMPSTLALLVSLLLHEQVEETVSLDISGSTVMASATSVTQRDHELTQEELDSLIPQSEPQRCYEWMKTMFLAKSDGELTQVEFWNLYKDIFSPFQDRFPLLVASDVIKNVNVVFPSAQAMVLPGPPQKFIVRGVDRRKDPASSERFKCLWDRSQCPTSAFTSPGQLYDHILSQHIHPFESSEMPCLWASCPRHSLPKPHLRAHVLTHLPGTQLPAKHPWQSDSITLPSERNAYPAGEPTGRPPPPLRKSMVTFQKPVIDAPSTSLTALLCIRILFRASFASTDAAPRVDADHFGFPGVVEDVQEQDIIDDGYEGTSESEKEGEKRGRKAFVRVRKLMEGVRIRDETLMGWIVEMVDTGISGTQ